MAERRSSRRGLQHEHEQPDSRGKRPRAAADHEYDSAYDVDSADEGNPHFTQLDTPVVDISTIRAGSRTATVPGAARPQLARSGHAISGPTVSGAGEGSATGIGTRGAVCGRGRNGSRGSTTLEMPKAEQDLVVDYLWEAIATKGMCGWLVGPEIVRARASTDAMGEELEGSMARRVVEHLTDNSAWFRSKLQQDEKAAEQLARSKVHDKTGSIRRKGVQAIKTLKMEEVCSIVELRERLEALGREDTLDPKDVYGAELWTEFVMAATNRGTPAAAWLEGDDPDLKRKWECQCLVTIAGSGRPQARITIQTWLIKVGKALKATPTDWSQVVLNIGNRPPVRLDEEEREAALRRLAGEEEW